MRKKIWFDMDGTIADLYGVENWLDYLRVENVKPYAEAKPLVNLSILARYLNCLQKKGYEIGVISWLSKCGTDSYNAQVTAAKNEWLTQHLPSVKWNCVKITKYGLNKWAICQEGILFDDETQNRANWGDESYPPDMIFKILKRLAED